jgi:hypothetical protein
MEGSRDRESIFPNPLLSLEVRRTGTCRVSGKVSVSEVVVVRGEEAWWEERAMPGWRAVGTDEGLVEGTGLTGFEPVWVTTEEDEGGGVEEGVESDDGLMKNVGETISVPSAVRGSSAGLL